MSRIKVWSTAYINHPEIRPKEDENKIVIQIEHVAGDIYIVEVV